MKTFLLDANVLIALTIAEHEHHDRASEWLSGVERFAVCPIVEGSLIRFLLRLGEPMATAHVLLDGVRASPACTFWSDSISHLTIDSSSIVGHRQVTDSYLAGLARSHGERLATLDVALAARHPDDCLFLPPTTRG